LPALVKIKIRIQLTQSQAGHGDRAQSIARGSGMTKTILIVEDNKLNMKLFTDLLQAHGYKTIQSANGMDTMQLARKHRPDLILMDIQLPEISGLEHTRMLKADDDLKDIPVVAVTAFALRADEENMFEAGCDGYITKPISVPDFLAEIKKFLTLEYFRLTESLITGHAEVDAQHEELAVLLNEFMVFFHSGDERSCVRKINEITKPIESHFESEEKIMKELGYRNFDSHKEDHSMVIRKYNTLIKDTERNGFGDGFTNQLTAILVHDMIRTDMDFKKYLQEIDYRE
jgi:two-component system cell cycle response regulator DivK